MSTSIQFSPDAIHPIRSNHGIGPGGVYSTRNASKSSSLVHGHAAKEIDLENADEEPSLKQEGDLRTRQVSRDTAEPDWLTHHVNYVL